MATVPEHALPRAATTVTFAPAPVALPTKAGGPPPKSAMKKSGSGFKSAPAPAAGTSAIAPPHMPKTTVEEGQRQVAPAASSPGPPRELFKVRHSLSERQLEALKREFPAFHCVVTHESQHQHAVIAVERALIETLMFRHVHRLRSQGAPPDPPNGPPPPGAGPDPPRDNDRCRPGLPWIHDIGGSPVRHYAAGRDNVWCSCPILDAADALRNHNRETSVTNPAHRRWCSELCQDCLRRADAGTEHIYNTVLVDVHYLMAVHSLYYLPAPGTTDGCVIDIVHAAKKRYLIAAVHAFPDAYGSFHSESGQPEATYRVFGDGQVEMQVAGNSTAYIHSALGWLHRTNSATKRVNGVVRGLVWRRIGVHGSVQIWEFIGVDDDMPANPPAVKHYDAALRDATYYGPVSAEQGGGGIGTILDRARIETVAVIDDVTVTTQAFYSWGPFYVLGTSASESVAVPKQLINELAEYMMPMPRTPETYKAIKMKAANAVKTMAIPANLRPRVALTAAVLAFCRDVDHETTLITHHITPHETAIRLHADATKGIGGASWWWRVFQAPIKVRQWQLTLGLAAAGVVVGAYYLRRAGFRITRGRPQVHATAGQHFRAGARLLFDGVKQAWAPPPKPWYKKWLPTAFFGGSASLFASTPSLPDAAINAVGFEILAEVVDDMPGWFVDMAVDAVLLTPYARAFAYDFLMDAAGKVFGAVVVAPVVEELLKSGVSQALAYGGFSDGASGLVTGAAFALFEHVVLGRSFMDSFAPAMLHITTATLPLPAAMAAHSIYNVYVMTTVAIGAVARLRRMGVTATTVRAHLAHRGPLTAFADASWWWPTLTSASLSYSAAFVAVVIVGAGAFVLWRSRRRAPPPCEVIAGPPPAHDLYRGTYMTFAPTTACVYHHVIGLLPGFVSTATPAAITEAARLLPGGDVRTTGSTFYAAGVCSLATIPLVPTPSPENEWISLTNRQLCANPNELERRYPRLTPDGVVYDPYDKSAMAGYHTFLDHYMADMYPVTTVNCEYYVDGRLAPPTFESWSRRYPTTTRLALVQAREALRHDDVAVVRMYGCKAFVKVECLLGSGPFYLKDAIPRCILSSQPELNAATGPDVFAASKLSAACWHSRNHLYFTSGATAEELGSWRDWALMTLPDGLDVEVDYERFDSTYTAAMEEAELRKYQHMRMHHSTIKHLRKAQGCYGHSRHGHKFSIKDRRRSGVQQTSDGNTTGNGTVDVYDHACRAGALNRAAMESEDVRLNTVQPGQLMAWMRDNMIGAYLGDDVATRLSEVAMGAMRRNNDLPPDMADSEWHAWLSADITHERRRLGLRPVPVIRPDPDDLEFCSGLFWPTAEGPRVFGPKPFRAAAKFGYYSQPHPIKWMDAIVRGDALGRANDCAHVPYINHVVSTALRAAGKGAVRHDRNLLSRVHAAAAHAPGPATYAMFYKRYGWDEGQLAHALSVLDAVTSVPASYWFEGLSEAVERDTGLALTQ